ncbi:MAG: hypothetical protein HY393_03705 [Candidatus Diapherotrites archaeon]|nr:hypothetical protein [Candidatus Diapherotrites archaeon]
MKLSEAEVKAIVDAVKKEPRTVQDISLLIDKSWVTTEKYLQELHNQTGAINLKTFRPGTQAALKVVYYVSTEGGPGDEVKQGLAQRILQGKFKQDFDFLDVFQFIPDAQKKAFTRESGGRRTHDIGRIGQEKGFQEPVLFFWQPEFFVLGLQGQEISG